MAIGNLNYVRKHYSPELNLIQSHFDQICDIWPKAPKSRRKLNIEAGCLYVNVGLEIHTSPHTSAWHGVRAFKNPDGTIKFKPMSFYGRGCVTIKEIRKHLGTK